MRYYFSISWGNSRTFIFQSCIHKMVIASRTSAILSLANRRISCCMSAYTELTSRFFNICYSTLPYWYRRSTSITNSRRCRTITFTIVSRSWRDLTSRRMWESRQLVPIRHPWTTQLDKDKQTTLITSFRWIGSSNRCSVSGSATAAVVKRSVKANSRSMRSSKWRSETESSFKK